MASPLQIDPWWRTDDDPLKAGAPTWADAWRFHKDAWEERGRAMPPLGEWLSGATGEYLNAMLLGSTAPGMRGPSLLVEKPGAGLLTEATTPLLGPPIRAYHGSPHSFERFDTSKIGTGEGAQAYGHGLYFAENEGVARSYRDRLGGRIDLNAGKLGAGTPENWGHMYEVNLKAEPHELLDWGKPLKDQPHIVEKLPSDVREQLLRAGQKSKEEWGDLGVGTNADDYTTGQGLVRHLTDQFGDPAATSEWLHKAGIKGIRYLDQGSRGAGEGTHNIVMFSPENIEIIRKFGLAGLGLGTATAAGAADQ